MQMMYRPLGGDLEKPEEQFCSVLRSKWKDELSVFKSSEEGMRAAKSDVTLLVSLEERGGEPEGPLMWRRIVVSGGLTLRALADKVLIPVMQCLWWSWYDVVFRLLCKTVLRLQVPAC